MPGGVPWGCPGSSHGGRGSWAVPWGCLRVSWGSVAGTYGGVHVMPRDVPWPLCDLAYPWGAGGGGLCHGGLLGMPMGVSWRCPWGAARGAMGGVCPCNFQGCPMGVPGGPPRVPGEAGGGCPGGCRFRGAHRADAAGGGLPPRGAAGCQHHPGPAAGQLQRRGRPDAAASPCGTERNGERSCERGAGPYPGAVPGGRSRRSPVTMAVRPRSSGRERGGGTRRSPWRSSV